MNLDNLNDAISKIKNNLDVLPQDTKANKIKYVNYIDEAIKVYNGFLNDADIEIKARYNAITSKNEDVRIKELLEKKDDFKIFAFLDSRISAYQKMGLDELSNELRHFYKDDLDNVNEVIFKIIGVFNQVGILLQGKDFSYTNYVNQYIQTLMSNQDDSNIIHDTFANLYWKCPDLIKQIDLNINYLYYKYEKKINQYFNNLMKSKKIETYQQANIKDSETLKELKHSDYAYLLGEFRNHNLIIGDYSLPNIDKLKGSILLDKDNQQNYTNLLKLDDSLEEYEKYNKFIILIKKIKELYKDRNGYKGKYDAKLKEIAKKEGQLFSLNKKIMSTGFFKVKEDKLPALNLKINNLVSELIVNYEELDDLRTHKMIYNELNDQSSLYDILLLVVNDFNFIESVLKEQNDKVTTQEISDYIFELQKYLYKHEFNIINNIMINEERNMAQMICDRYKLVNINLSEENLAVDALEGLRKNIKTLLVSYDLEIVNLKYEDIDFIIEVDKMKPKEG